MGKTEHSDTFEKPTDSVLMTSLDSSVLAQILGVTESRLDFVATYAKERNLNREVNLSYLVASQSFTKEGIKRSLVEDAITEFQISKESNSVQQYLQRIAVVSKMVMSGVKNPEEVLDLLAENTAVYTLYEMDFSKIKPKVKSFNYDTINTSFMEFIAEFDNPTLLFDRLNKLKINVSLRDIDLQREKAKDLLNQICKIPEEDFQKVVSDLNPHGLLRSCDIIQDTHLDSQKSLHKDFISRMRVLKNGGLTDEEKELLKALDDTAVIFPTIRNNYGLEAVLDNKQFLKNLLILLSEQALLLTEVNIPKDFIDRVNILEERGVLSKLAAIFSSGIVFSIKNDFSYEYGVVRRTVLDSISLEDDHESKENIDKVINLIELTYDNLTNKEFNLMRSYLGIFTVEGSYLVKEALDLSQVTKTKIATLSLDEKRKLYKFLRSDTIYDDSVQYAFTQIWENWLIKYDYNATEKVKGIILGILKLDDDLITSQLELAIKQNARELDPEIRAVISSKNYREGRDGKIGDLAFKILPIDTVRIDKDHVVDQNMDIIQLSKNQLRVQLFLTQKAWTSALTVLREDSDDPKVSISEICYSNKKVVDAVRYQPIDGLVISLASDSNMRATIGLVDINVDLSKIDKDTYIQEINLALSYLAGLGSDENLLSPTDEKSDEMLIKELYKLNTKEPTPPDDITFERKLVFDGYETFTIPDRHKVLREKYGSFVTFHNLHDSDHLLQVLKNGVFASHERYRRGMLIEGLSTWEDFERGGANCVFTRTFSEKAPDDLYGINLIFDPEIWDRLDFYIYDDDNFGDTDEEIFNTRLSPEEYLSQFGDEPYEEEDEQMFRRGIPPEMFKGIIVSYIGVKNQLIKELNEMGIFSINGKSLDDFIYYNSHTDDDLYVSFDIAEGLPIGTTRKRKIEEKSRIVDDWLEEDDEPEVFSIFEILDKDLKVSQIIEAISSSDEYLEEQFQSSAHVSEGYTIEELALLVGGQYEKYFAQKHSQMIFTYQEIKIGLSLYGIGRHEAFIQDGSIVDHHKFTKKIALDVLIRAGFPESRASLMVDILTQDILIKYLQSGDSEEALMSAATAMLEIIKNHDLTIYFLINTMKMFFTCVVSSHTQDATGTPGFIDLLDIFEFTKDGDIVLSEEVEDKIQKLRDRVFASLYSKAST